LLTAWYLEAPQRPAEEAAALRDLLSLGPGAAVAEIGAGDGAVAVELARIVGSGGQVFANELDAALVETIRNRARGAGVANLTAVRAAEHATNLPDLCCDAIYMRRVYHDLTDPAGVVGSVTRALRPGGRVAILDFEPTFIGNALMPRRTNRSGHGVTRERLLEEMRAFGFTPEGRPADWADGMFAIVFKAGQPGRGRNLDAARLACDLTATRR
jgi:SAM-dependent methyltransferase